MHVVRLRHACSNSQTCLQCACVYNVTYKQYCMSETECYYAQIEKRHQQQYGKFSDYFLGQIFLIETDHKPLVSLLETKSLNSISPSILRFRLHLSRYSFPFIMCLVNYLQPKHPLTCTIVNGRCVWQSYSTGSRDVCNSMQLLQTYQLINQYTAIGSLQICSIIRFSVFPSCTTPFKKLAIQSPDNSSMKTILDGTRSTYCQ